MNNMETQNVHEDVQTIADEICSKFPDGIPVTPTQMMIIDGIASSSNGLLNVSGLIKEKFGREISKGTLRHHLTFVYRQMGVRAKQLGFMRARRLLVALRERGAFRVVDRRIVGE
jgi:hypothetical protein